MAIEEPEEAFAKRNFGSDYGKLYKPDYRSLNAENADVALKYIDDNPATTPVSLKTPSLRHLKPIRNG